VRRRPAQLRLHNIPAPVTLYDPIHGGIEIREPTTIEGDADQQCDDALGDGRDVVQRVRFMRHDLSVHVFAGEVLLVNERAMPDDNHTVGSSFRSFGKTRSCNADQLRVEPLLRWRGNRPVVRHGRRGAAFRRCPGSGNRRKRAPRKAQPPRTSAPLTLLGRTLTAGSMA
jgi:hypothetical protein